jgi:Xaa-Pro aminopeptidase
MKTNASLITNKTNIKYLSNFTGSSGFMLICKRTQYLFTDFRYIERAKHSIDSGIKIIDSNEKLKEILEKHKVKILGIEEADLTVKKFKKIKEICGKIKFKDISGEIENLREIKDEKEIKHTIKSQRINEKTLLEIKKFIQESLRKNQKITELETAWKIKELGYKFGAEDISFEPIVAFGKNTSIPHHLAGQTKLKKGDIIMIDMGMKYKGYCSDMTRMLFTKKPTKKQKEIYELVLKAQETAIKGIKAGITGAKADKLARDIIEKAGYGEKYGHAGGHGTGLDIHESPSLSIKYKNKLKANSIITIEPGIYIEGEFGIRIEDMLIVRKNDNKNITKITKSQDLLLVG